MGFSNYLNGSEMPDSSDLPAVIDRLEDSSIEFTRCWRRSDLGNAGRVSRQAMVHLDFVVNELLREKAARLGQGSYSGSRFEAGLNAPIASGVTGVTLADQMRMFRAGPGNGSLPVDAGTRVALTLDRLLNKIKHRNPDLINFRIENDRHIFLICPDHTAGGAEGIYEFDVREFCRVCESAAADM